MTYTRISQKRRILALVAGTLAACVALSRTGVASHPMFEQLLETADTRTLSEWAKRYEDGVSVPRNIDRAIELYCKAARRGDADAQFGLGSIYTEGHAGMRNEALGAAWLKLAARKGNRSARKMLQALGVNTAEVKRKPTCVLSADLTSEIVTKRPGKYKFASYRPKPTNSAARKGVEALVKKLAPQYGLNPGLVLSVIEVESNFNSNALSPKNAQGLMQLIPATASRFGVDDVWDPEQNLRGGMAYLRWLLKHFNGDVELALAGYNAGEKAVQRYNGIPPYRETQNYVRRITENLMEE